MKKMYVWHPKSIADYYDGVVCVIAESKKEAIELAVVERHPFAKRRRGLSERERAALELGNMTVMCERAKFRDELKREKPRVVRRGSVIEFGGG